MPRIERPALLLLVLLLLSASRAGAQTTTSTIEGTVTDATGAVLAGVEVKVSGSALGSERTVTTGANGFYRVTALPAGTYTLAISAKGFAPRTLSLELALNRVAVLDVALQVGDIEAVVEVRSPVVDATTAATGAICTRIRAWQ